MRDGRCVVESFTNLTSKRCAAEDADAARFMLYHRRVSAISSQPMSVKLGTPFRLARCAFLWALVFAAHAAATVESRDIDPSELGKIVNVSSPKISPDGKSIAFTGTTAIQPAELYYLSSPDAKPRRPSDFNHDTAAMKLGRVGGFELRRMVMSSSRRITSAATISAARLK
jgi:hypothetical protein